MDLTPFRRLVTKASLTRIALGATLLYWMNTAAIALLELLGVPVPDAWWDLSTDLEASYYLLVLLTAICFIVWSYSAHANLARLGRAQIRHRNQATIWWWIVPIANFVVPYRVVGETARGSLAPLDDHGWRSTPLPSVVRWWTVLFVVGQLVYEVTNRALSVVPAADLNLELMLIGLAAGSLLLTGAAATAISLVAKVTGTQATHAEAMAHRVMMSPPPPIHV